MKLILVALVVLAVLVHSSTCAVSERDEPDSRHAHVLESRVIQTVTPGGDDQDDDVGDYSNGGSLDDDPDDLHNDLYHDVASDTPEQVPAGDNLDGSNSTQEEEDWRHNGTAYNTEEFDDSEDSHFFSYLITAVFILVILVYLLYNAVTYLSLMQSFHMKQKLTNQYTTNVTKYGNFFSEQDRTDVMSDPLLEVNENKSLPNDVTLTLGGLGRTAPQKC